jgi:senataxin
MQRDAATVKILNGADVVFSTLAFSGSATFKKITAPFDTIVIDEAAQALEPSCLVPQNAGTKQVYMIGDPVQLPATVISKRAVAANFQQSLFKRLQDSGYPVSILQVIPALPSTALVPPCSQTSERLSNCLCGQSIQQQPHAFLLRAPTAVDWMQVQYRMHPAIAQFASDEFYSGKIRNGPNVLAETTAPYHQLKGLGPLAFYHVDGVEETPEGSASLVNIAEADMVIALIQTLITQVRWWPPFCPALQTGLLCTQQGGSFLGQMHSMLCARASLRQYFNNKNALQDAKLGESGLIGVISPYKSQVQLIRARTASVLPDAAANIDVNTIDGFQGREKDVILFSAVRSRTRGPCRIGFVADERRINVGLTRARCSLLLVGHRIALAQQQHWKALIQLNADGGCALLATGGGTVSFFVALFVDLSPCRAGHASQASGLCGMLECKWCALKHGTLSHA